MAPTDTQDGPASPGWGLVLGGGGSVGIAHVSGTLRALAEHGVDLPGAGLVIGTSAGAVAAAALRKGAAPEDLLAFADAAPDDLATAAGRAPRHYEPAWATRRELWHRAIGSSAVVGRSMLRLPIPVPPPRVDVAYPGGLFRPRGDGMTTRLGVAWPDAPLWVVAVDLETRRRVALGRHPADRMLPLHRAIMASCAVPGVYEPVVLHGRRLVDGGVNSTTSLDLAVRAGCSRVIAVVPMGWQGDGRPPSAGHRLIRGAAVRGVRRELRRAGDRARDVLVVQPHVDDLALHGTNFLRGTDNGRVAERAYDRARTLLEQPEAAEFVAALVDASAS